MTDQRFSELGYYTLPGHALSPGAILTRSGTVRMGWVCRLIQCPPSSWPQYKWPDYRPVGRFDDHSVNPGL